MKSAINLVIVFILSPLVLVLIIWHFLSRRLIYRRLPDECTIRKLQKEVRERFEIDVDISRLEHDFIPSNDVCLHLDILSAEKGGPTVVFMPGTAAYAELYIEFLFALNSQGFNVIGFDPRGHGRSSGRRGDFTVDQLVEDAINVVTYAKERFGGRVGMSGSSQGGVVTFYVAATGEHIDSAMCHNFADLNGKDNLVLSKIQLPQWAVGFALWLFGHLQDFIIPITFYVNFDHTLKDGSSAVDFVKNDPIAVPAYSLRTVSSLGRSPMPAPVEDIKTPIMLLGSSEDEVFPASYVESIYERLTCEKTYVNLEGLPHLIMVNNVPQVIGPVAEWFKRTLRS